jgi:hypothetical protein
VTARVRILRFSILFSPECRWTIRLDSSAYQPGAPEHK